MMYSDKSVCLNDSVGDITWNIYFVIFRWYGSWQIHTIEFMMYSDKSVCLNDSVGDIAWNTT